jgi:hypothetical protein
MHRYVSSALFFVSLIFACAAFAQDDPMAASATCNFDQDRQLVVHYQRFSIDMKKALSAQVPFNKPWAPGGKPITFFTNGSVQIGPRVLGIGAYTLFVIPSSKHWTLVVSNSTDTSGAYDEKNDLVRVPMDAGELPSPGSDLVVTFAHVAPNECSLRIDLDKYGHFAVFQKR